jgi:hypothetical protein
MTPQVYDFENEKLGKLSMLYTERNAAKILRVFQNDKFLLKNIDSAVKSGYDAPLGIGKAHFAPTGASTEVISIRVEEQFRHTDDRAGCKIGRDTLLCVAAVLPCEKIRLNAVTSAVGFYEKLGFKFDDYRTMYMSVPAEKLRGHADKFKINPELSSMAREIDLTNKF